MREAFSSVWKNERASDRQQKFNVVFDDANLIELMLLC
jgi:hypothetical protein